jgi:[glutamine synthetase] adenylyltransferase / [glutamine synthetase]-adenylyl-L-tyrosine phosphorylase
LPPKLPSHPDQPLDVAAATAQIPFQNSASAQENLVRVSGRIPPSLAGVLPALLAESPDPDSALIQFDRLVNKCASEMLRLLDRHNPLAHYALLVFGHSRFLGETLLQNSDLLPSLVREKKLDRSLTRDEFHESLARLRSHSLETDVSLLLARFKRREFVRIMLRDVLKIAPLAETTAEISALADVLIEEALREADSSMRKRHDTRQHVETGGRLADTPFAVLSLGKLGGNELNYSSDVDLMYIFGDGPAPFASAISSREYFIRLAQRVTEILSRVTREGAVFRIDLRLRPQGSEGELAISLRQALNYYAVSAHDWEKQALLKVRCSAGNMTLAREFMRGVQPHVYTPKVNFAAIKTALLARERMHRKHQQAIGPAASGASLNVKLDAGGIRDIEFLVQCLQRVYGGTETWLRSGGTLFSLQKLHDNRHISSREFHELTAAYEFLRHVEHRLQLRQGRQTHRLPSDKAELQILERCMRGYTPTEGRSLDLTTLVRDRMRAVAEIYHRVIYQQQNRSPRDASNAEFHLRGTLEPSTADHSNQQILERLATDAPGLYQTAVRRNLSPQAQKNLFRFLSACLTSSESYAMAVRHQDVFPRALALFEVSEYLTHILVRYPEELATLADLPDAPGRAGSFYLFNGRSSRGQAAGDPVFAYLADSHASYGERLALLRRHFRHRMLVAGATDITTLRDVYESFRATTSAAEEALAAAFGIAGNANGLAVMALGRLGGGEFDLLSDADVLFVCEEKQDRVTLTKVAERIVQVLAAYTREGMVFSVDARLRPRGSEGELLVTPAQLATYFEQAAHPWEALMYTKLRFLAGSKALAEQALASTRILFQRYSAEAGFLAGVRDMRAKLDTADTPEKSFKTSPGAIYDIDFLSGYLLVKNCVPEKGGSQRDRLWRCAASGLLHNSDAAALDHAAELLRTVEHVVRLVVGRARKWLPGTEHARQVTERLTAQILGREFPQGLESELEQTCRTVRQIYEKVLSV